MALVKYIGAYAEVAVPDAKNQHVKKGNSIEVSTELATVMLLDTVNWEAGDEETRELEPAPAEETTRTITADYVIGSVLEALFANATSKNLKVTVPKANTNRARQLVISNIATNTKTVTLVSAGGEFRGAEGLQKEVVLGKEQPYTSATIVSDGTDWNIT